MGDTGVHTSVQGRRGTQSTLLGVDGSREGLSTPPRCFSIRPVSRSTTGVGTVVVV